MSNYTQVSEALDRGVQPEMICSTCPWDRLCIEPPSMTRAEVAEKTAVPKVEDGQSMTDKVLTNSIINLLAFAGKDQSATVCPVLAVRLRTNDGKHVADTIRSIMQTTAVEVAR